jgi:site-specific DNA-methyltransferase (adenine-specific)
MQSRKVKIAEVKPNPNNPRQIKDDKFAKLVQSIKDFPEMLDIRPIVVNADMVVLGGNMRFKACKEAGLKEVPIIVAENLTDEQQKEFIIKDNVSGGEWDWDMLANEWEVEQLDAWGLDIPINLEVELEAEEDDFEVPEGGIETDIVLGDLFEIGEHRLLCGDSTDSDSVAKLMNGEKADMVFTDPPYGIDYSGGRTQVVETKTYGKLMNDDLQGVELGELISNVFLFNKQEADVYICVSPKMQKPFLDFIENSNKVIDAVIVWDKKQPGLGYMAYRRQCEFILFIKGGAFKKGDNSDFDLWSISRDNGKDYVHGTQKPLGVPSRAINNSSKKDDLVLDYFGGSGSTMVASHQLKRKCYGMELDPKYCQVIIDRMKKLDSTLIIKRNGIRQE